MTKTILITGGAGFIGSHLADELLQEGYQVRVLDSLSEQVHGSQRRRPDYLNPEVEFQLGDIRNTEAVRRALRQVDAVFHFAAMVGVGQSMYQISDYTSVNNEGTAVLLQALIEKPVEKLLVASSMSLYGEGLYRTQSGRLVAAGERNIEQLQAHQWELQDALEGPLLPVPTPETKPPCLASIYALSKYDQERMSLMIGRSYHIPTVALRFFNVYGTRQALSNPYTGVLAIFASRLLNHHPPSIFEDGYQQRDFVSVHDVVRACRLALESPSSIGKAFNIGSGRSFTVREVADRMAKVINQCSLPPEITQRYRVGDIRHCFADITLARETFGYEPAVSFDQGLLELAGWLEGQVAVDQMDKAKAELVCRGLTV